MTANAQQIEINVEEVITIAAKTAVAQSHPDLTDDEVQRVVNTARENDMYQLMIAAIRPEAAAAVLVREAMRNAKAMARSDR